MDKPVVQPGPIDGGRGGWLPTRRFVSEHVSVGVGTATARLLSFLAAAVMARWLGPEEFGRFSLAFCVMAMLAQLSSAADNAMIKHIGAEPPHENNILGGALLLKLAFHGLVFVIGLIVAKPVLSFVLRKDNFLMLYILALAGAGLSGLYNLSLAYFRARLRFHMFAAWSVGYSALVLVGVCAVNLLVARTALANLLLMTGLTAAVVFAWWTFTARTFSVEQARAYVRPLWHFGAWLGVSTLAAAVHQRLDVFVLSSFADYVQLGKYSAAVRIAMVPDLVNQAIAVLLFPKAVSVHNPQQLRRYFKESALMVSVALAAGLATIAFAGPLLALFFGPEFADAMLPARLLCGAMLALVVYAPLSYLFYTFNRPQLIAALGLFKLGTALVLALLLVPRLGATGAALTMLFTNLLALVCVVIATSRLLTTAGWRETGEPAGTGKQSHD